MTALTKESERALIDRVLKGETEAFEVLVVEYQKKIYNLALRMTRNPSDAEDITQEAFIKAYNNLSGFRLDSSFYVWVYRIASNLCIDFLRREKLRNESSLVLETEEDDERVLDIPDLRAMPEEAAERAELREAIRAGLDSLSPKHRQILVMRDISGLTYAEIGRALELEEGTVKSRICRARAALAGRLAEKGNLFAALPSKRKDGR